MKIRMCIGTKNIPIKGCVINEVRVTNIISCQRDQREPILSYKKLTLQTSSAHQPSNLGNDVKGDTQTNK